MLCCSLLICFLFWDSWIGQFVANPSILANQLGGMVNFRGSIDVQKAVNWRRWFCDKPLPSATAKATASVVAIWDKESSRLFTPRFKQTRKIDFNEPTINEDEGQQAICSYRLERMETQLYIVGIGVTIVRMSPRKGRQLQSRTGACFCVYVKLTFKVPVRWCTSVHFLSASLSLNQSFFVFFFE